MMILLKAWVCRDGSILQQLLYWVYSLLISLTVESPIPKCYAVYANIQGSKNQQCRFYHRVIDSNQHKKGKIVQLECQCIFHYYFPHFIKDKPLSEYMAIVYYGQHDHPPPPAIRISSTIKNELVRMVHTFGGSAECTAQCLIASPMLPIMLNGQTELNIALFNQDALN